jgi:pimeloyl-ACP methyl ester carboxylesterase
VETYAHDGLTFEVSDSGPSDGRTVIVLHGFPEDRHCWAGIAAPLSEAGYRVLAPDQRGYSPGARPAGRRSYVMSSLDRDVLALLDAAGVDRVDVVGHDWGGLVAWDLAARYPERVRSVASLSTPHPRAVGDAMLHSTQLLHSWYIGFFQLPWLPEEAFSRGRGRPGARALERAGLDSATAQRYAVRFATPGAMTGPINWYRALPYERKDRTPNVGVRSLYVWSDGDRFLTRAAAERTANYVTGPYRFEILVGQNHWLPTNAAGLIAPLLLEHLAAVED